MIWKRQLAIFGIAFSLVLAGGMALAAVGTLSTPSDDVGAWEEGPYEEEPWEQPEEEPEEEPYEEEPAEEPHDEGIHEEEGSGEGEHGEEPHEEEPAEEPYEQEPAEEPEEEPKADTTPPDFGITSPENGAHVENKVVTFKGFVEPGSTVTRGKWTADREGEHWSLTLVVSPGKNVVGFLATDAAGNVSDASVTVYYEPPEKEEPKEQPKEEEPEPDEVEWSVHQQYGSCGENPPYEVFWGTATPGTKIWIESKYGGTSVTANADGHWEVKVTFYEVPAGKSFEIVVESSDGHRKVFPFTYTGGGGEEGGGEEV